MLYRRVLQPIGTDYRLHINTTTVLNYGDSYEYFHMNDVNVIFFLLDASFEAFTAVIFEIEVF